MRVASPDVTAVASDALARPSHSYQRVLSTVETQSLGLADNIHGILALSSIDLGPDAHRFHRFRDWVLQDSSRGSDRAAPWMSKTGTGWVVTRRSRTLPGSNGEAHQGQLILYLHESGLDAIPIVAPDGTTCTVASLLRESMQTASVDSETDYLIPAVLAIEPMPRWRTRYGSDLDINDLVVAHLEADPMDHACGGIHWCSALSSLSALGKAAGVRPELEKAAQELAAAWVERALVSVDTEGRAGWFTAVDGRTPGGIDQQVSIQAHMLEWLAWALSDDQFATDSRIHRVALWLASLPDSTWAVLPLATECHAIRALSLYSRRVRGSLRRPDGLRWP